MLAMCQPEVPLNALFREPEGNSQLRATALTSRGCRPDQNLNFVGEGEACDSNENWSQPAPAAPGQGQRGRTMGSCPGQAECRPEDASGGPKTPSEPFASEEEDGEDIRSPPEGAEFGGPEGEKSGPRERPEEAGRLLSSPLEDNGYASSSLSIDSPEAGGPTAWEALAFAPEDWSSLGEAGASPTAEPEDSSPSSEALFPALAEAFRSLQDKKKLKEREKEKHHVRLVMYRRLALLRWIRGLQQKVVDQQNRLQESFDTILDNRKELIRCVQRGTGYPRSNPAQAEL